MRGRMHMRSLRIALATLLCMTGLGWGRTLTVGRGLGYDYGGIQVAINAAGTGDTVVVAPGWYETRIDFKGKNIVLTSEDPNSPSVVGDTVIMAGNGWNMVPVVTFAGSEDERCGLLGFTISNGDDIDYGAGILGNGTKAMISHCVISGNRARIAGGGIHDCDGMIRDSTICENRVNPRSGPGHGGGLSDCDGAIVNCNIYGNDAGDGDGPYGFGGGLANCNGTIQDCEIYENLAVKGGGLYACNGTIGNCTIRGNGSRMSGGGLFGCSGTITDCTVQNNQSAKEFAGYCGGGGLAECEAFIAGCTIENNAALDSPGGGLHKCNGRIRECVIKGNSAEKSGGGLSACDTLIEGCQIVGNKSLYWHGGGAADCNSFLNCTISDNSARGYGGGLYQCKSVSRCTITANTSEIYPGGGLSECEFVVNCVVSDNGAGESGGGLHDCPNVVNCTILGNSVACSPGSFLVLTNSILWGKRSDSISDRGDEATISVSYSNIQGGWPGVGNINTDPLFAEPKGPDNIPGTADDDLRLSPISPCIDSGDPDSVTTPHGTDFALRPRIVSGRIDMGVYEFQGTIYADDDAPEDPGPGDRLVSDPLENGAEAHPMDSIQEAIDWAKDGYTVLVRGGLYSEPIDFKGKAITVQSGPDMAVLEAPEEYAVSFYSGEGPDTVLRNFVIRNSQAGVFVPGSSPTIRNLTVVDNEYGITAYTWAEPDIRNCIFWNNRERDLFQCEARYSCIEDSDPGEGNLSADPLFIDANNGDYHLLSAGWCWSTPTNFWTYADVTSPCIDRGDYHSPLRDELLSVPRDPDNEWGENLRVNMGAYGGTSQASMPPLGWLSREGEE